jgi:hypothetical protein
MQFGTSSWHCDFERLAGFLAALLSALAAFAFPLYAQQASPKPVTLAWLVHKMEARERRAASASLRWTQSERYSVGAILAKPSEFTFACEMLLKGDSMRYVGKTFSHNVGGGGNVIDHFLSYDRNEHTYLQGAKSPLRRILGERASTDDHLFTLLPFRLYFRPFAGPYAPLKQKTLKLLDDRKTIDGHECVTVDDGHLRVYLDRDRDFVPVAFQAYGGNGVLRLDGNIEYYSKEDAMRWVPKAFQVTLHVKGQNEADRIRGDDVQTDIGDLLKDSDFSVIFEPGMTVWDERTGQQYRIRQDGSKEPIAKRPRKIAPPKR